MAEEALLVEWFSGPAAAPPVALCRRVVQRAGERLREGDHVSLERDLRFTRLLLHHSRALHTSEGLGACTVELMQGVCLPYLGVLLQDCAASQKALQELAKTVGVALQSPHFPGSVAREVIGEGLASLLSVARESSEQLANLSLLLSGVFAEATPEALEAQHDCSDQLSILFLRLLSLTGSALNSTYHHFLSSLLPPFITPSHPHRLGAMWTMLEEVWCGQRIVELQPLTFSLSLLCCFSDVFISPDNSSPFLSSFPSAVHNQCPLHDVRGEGVLWEVVLTGLHSSDPLNRKKAMFLLDR